MLIKRSCLEAALLLAVSGLLADATRAPAAGRLAPRGEPSRSARADTASERAAIERAVEAVYPALVRIHVVSEEGDAGRMQKLRATGSGVIVSEDGYVLSNHHVAGRATRVVCRLSDREELDAAVVGTDALSDICVLKLDLSGRRGKGKLPVASYGDSDKLAVGDMVLAMGSPAGLSQSVTRGIVANTAMILPNNMGNLVLDGERVGELVRWIGHDAVIYPGNSGGPLVNSRGEIVGVNEVSVGSLGGAIPSNLARAVARELIARGSVARSWIGLEVQPLLKQDPSGSGVLVSGVLPESPAAGAGLQAGDLITAFNGVSAPACRAPEDIPLFNRLVLETPTGAQVTLQGLRQGQPRSWTLKTEARDPVSARETELKHWGLTVRSLTRLAALENHRPDRKGVLVDTVRPGGPCAESKPALRQDDLILRVNDQEVADAAGLMRFTAEFIRGLTEPKPVLVTFLRGVQEWVTVARIGPEPQEDKPSRPAKAWLGAQTQVLTSELAEAFGLEGRKGVRITGVLPGSPAQKAGLQVGDLLLKLDGQVIPASTPSDQDLFDNLIREYKVGSEAELSVVRAGQPLTLTASLVRQPKPSSDLEEYKDQLFEFKARELSLADRVDEKLSAEAKAVRIVSVENAGWAALAGLASGDVLLAIDGRPAESIPAVKAVMAGLSETRPRRVTFFVRRGIRTQFIEIEPKW